MVSRYRFDSMVADTLEILYGGNVPKKVPSFMKLIAEVLEKPNSMYLHIEKIINAPEMEDHRLHLARVQMDSELHMRDDVDRHTQRLWVAQTIEKMIFGGLMVEGEKVNDEDEDEEES